MYTKSTGLETQKRHGKLTRARSDRVAHVPSRAASARNGKGPDSYMKGSGTSFFGIEGKRADHRGGGKDFSLSESHRNLGMSVHSFIYATRKTNQFCLC